MDSARDHLNNAGEAVSVLDDAAEVGSVHQDTAEISALEGMQREAGQKAGVLQS